MSKHREASDNALIEMLRSRGATVGPSTAERRAQIERAHAAAEPTTMQQPTANHRSPIRKFKSQTEKRFAYYLDGLIADKKILRWRYEAERLHLADHNQPAVTYTPDFVAWLTGGGRIFYEVKSKYRRDSDTETRRIFLWARQQYGDPMHHFQAFRETDGRPGDFYPIWSGLP